MIFRSVIYKFYFYQNVRNQYSLIRKVGQKKNIISSPLTGTGIKFLQETKYGRSVWRARALESSWIKYISNNDYN